MNVARRFRAFLPPLLLASVVGAVALLGPEHARAATPGLRFGTPAHRSVAAHSAFPGYRSPTTQTNVTLSLGSDAAADAIRVAVDVGLIALGANQSCDTAQESVATVTSASSLTLTFCAREFDPPGPATLTAENLTVPGPMPTATVTIARRPATVSASVSGNRITATVTDATGNRVADGTPVRFAVPADSTLYPNSCHVTSNGSASFTLSTTASIAANAAGAVRLFAGWNETGDPAACGTPPDNEVAGVVAYAASIPVTPVPAGIVTGGSIPREGGFGIIVYGGTVDAIKSAAGCPATSTTAAFWAGINGEFVPYVPSARVAAVNAVFLSAFAQGIPPGTALIGRCR